MHKGVISTAQTIKLGRDVTKQILTCILLNLCYEEYELEVNRTEQVVNNCKRQRALELVAGVFGVLKGKLVHK